MPITFTPVPQSELDRDPDSVIGPLPQITFSPAEVDQELRGPAKFSLPNAVNRVIGQPDNTMYEVDNTSVMAVQDMFNAFNRILTDTIGTAVDAGPGQSPLLQNLYGYMTGAELADKPIPARNIIKDWATKAGLVYNDAPVSELMDDIGEETFQQLIMSAAMLAGAGPMAAAAGEGVTASIIRDIGKWMKANPMATTVSNIGAGMGAQVGEEMTDSPLGEFAGAIVGGGAGATRLGPMLGKAIGAGAGALTGLGLGALTLSPMGAGISTAAGAVSGFKRGGQLAERILRAGIDKAGAALMGKNTSMDATSYAREVVEAEGARINRDLNDVYARLAGSGAGDPQSSAEQLRRSVATAYKNGQARAQQLWSRVDETQKAPLDNTTSIIAAILKENPRTAPENLDRTMDLFQRVGQLGAQETATKAPLPKYGGRATPPATAPTPDVTIKDLRGLQQVIGTRMREENIGDVQKRYLTQFFDALDNDIAAANPGDEALQTARDFTRWLHTNLSRGPLGKFNRAEGTKYSNSLQGDLEAATAMLRQSESGSQLATVAQTLNMPQLEQEAMAFARQTIAETFATKGGTAGAEAAQRAMSSPTMQRFMQNFPKQAAETQAESAMLQAALADQKQLEQSAFRAYAGMDPQEAIRSIMAGPQKVSKVSQIKDGLMDNLDATRGFKDGILAELYLKSGGSPKKMSELLSVKDMRDMVSTVLGVDDMKRLDRIVKAGMHLEKKGTLAGRSNTLVSRAFRYAGAGLSRLGGARTIQETGTAAAIGQTIGAIIMRDMPAETLFTRAIMDPKWEKIVYSRVPSTMRELLAHQELVKGLIGGTRALQTRSGENDRR